MVESQESGGEEAGAEALVALADLQAPFGPKFFVLHLRAFARERCPDPSERLPAVQLHLTSGEVLDLCHIIGLAPAWVALAVHETARPSGAPSMRTELVPYANIHRVTIKSVHRAEGHIGFDHGHPLRAFVPALEGEPPSPEEALRAAAVGQRQPPGPALDRSGAAPKK
jgi:hypothetical protein